jgi:hypothetical protein
MVEVSGAAAIFAQEKSSDTSKNLALCFEQKTKTEILSENIQKTVKTDNKNATHVVVGIEKGSKAFLTCQVEGEESLKNHLKAYLLSVSTGQVILEPQDEESSEMTKERNFSLFCDIKIDTRPTNLKEAVQLLHSMSEKLESDVPLNIWLLPLSRFNPNIHNKVREIGQEIVDNLIQQFELMEVACATVNGLLQLPITQQLPTLMSQNQRFIGLIDDNRNSLIASLKSLLPKARDLLQDNEEELTMLLQARNKSPFKKKSLDDWVKESEKQCETISKLLTLITDGLTNNVQVCTSEDELMFQIYEKEQLFNFAFSNLDLNSHFMDKMEAFTNTGNLADSYNATPYLKSIFEAMRKAQSFREFSLANQSNEKQCFAVSENFMANGTEENITVMKFNQGLDTVVKVLPSKPENARIEESSQNSATICWEAPKFGAELVMGYLLSAQIKDESNKTASTQYSKDILRCCLEKLKPGTVYQISLSACTTLGVSPNVCLEFGTLPGPPINLKAEMLQENQIKVAWDRSTETNLTGYQIQLEEKEGSNPDTFKVLEEATVLPTFHNHTFSQDFSLKKEYRVIISALSSHGKSCKETAMVSTVNCIMPSALNQASAILSTDDIFSAETLEQLIGVLQNLLNCKQELLQKLHVKTDIILWTNHILGLERFKMTLLRWVVLYSKACPQTLLKGKQQMKELLLPFSEENCPKDVQELVKIFSVISSPCPAPRPSLEAHDIKSFIGYIQQAKENENIDSSEFQQNTSLLFSNLDKNKWFSLSSALTVLLEPFQFDSTEKQFHGLLDPSKLACIEEALKKFLSVFLGQYAESQENELDILDSLVTSNLNQESLIRRYIVLRESYSASLVTQLLRKYLPFWRNDEIQSVLNSIRRTWTIDDFLGEKTIKTATKMHDYKVESPSTIPTKNETKLKQHEQIFWTPEITREKVYSISYASLEIHDKLKNEIDFLKPLLSLDYHCRNLNKNVHGEEIPLKNDSDCEDEEEFYNFVKPQAQIETSGGNNETSSADFVLQGLSKCDDFLLQDVFQKMSACQLAVPIVVSRDSQVVFHLWASRTIRKNWMNSVTEKKSNEGFVAGRKMGCISICRIGKTSISKSKLINGFISTAQGWPDHSYFLHRDVDSVSKFNGGCIEAVWYSPEGRPREHLKDICCIYNLRGDTRDHFLQFQFLMKVSSVVVILFENTELSFYEKELLKQTNANIVFIDNGKAGKHEHKSHV